MWLYLRENYYQITAMFLFGIGLSALLLDRNLVKKLIGLNICNSGIYLFLAAQGYIRGGAVPIVADGVQLYINPVPTGLILTGIVISVSVTAFALALVVRLYKRYQTLDIDELSKLVVKEGM
ncbi:MAG: cation:proton antiporter subunit C [Symbiobacteriaceae bacterium]|nr:cation:proton antiporter subunit C [Symbiobacteriaceae bacterium]